MQQKPLTQQYHSLIECPICGLESSVWLFKMLLSVVLFMFLLCFAVDFRSFWTCRTHRPLLTPVQTHWSSFHGHNKMFFTEDSSLVFSLWGPEMVCRWFIISAHWCHPALRLFFSPCLTCCLQISCWSFRHSNSERECKTLCVCGFIQPLSSTKDKCGFLLVDSHNLWCNEADKIRLLTTCTAPSWFYWCSLFSWTVGSASTVTETLWIFALDESCKYFTDRVRKSLLSLWWELCRSEITVEPRTNQKRLFLRAV